MTTIGVRPTHSQGGCMRCRGFKVWARCYGPGADGDDYVDFLCVDCDAPVGFVEIIDEREWYSMSGEEEDQFWNMIKHEAEEDRRAGEMQ